MQPIFTAFKSNSENKEIEAVFLLCMELAWHASEDYQIELNKKLDRLKSIEFAIAAVHEHYIDPKEQIRQEYVPESPAFTSGKPDEIEIDPIEESEITIAESYSESTENGIIAVVWEFDKESGYALDYAVLLSRKMETSIMLVHFTKKGKESDAALAEMKNKTVAEIRNKFGIEVDVKVVDRNTSLSVGVKEVAAGIVKLIILGANSSQRQLNTVCNSQIPVMAVQSPPRNNEIKNVLFPVDNRTETKIKLKIAKEFAEKLKLKFHISLPGKFLVDITKLKTHNNLNFARSFFRQNNIEHETVTIEDTKSFTDATNISAVQTDSDLILILPQEKIGLTGIVLGNEEQAIMKKNPKIPILFATTHGASTKLATGVFM
jgi:hypothetical protein